MKTKLKTALYCVVAAFAGVALGTHDSIQHTRQAAAQLHAICNAQPHLEGCAERKVVDKNVRYFFNGQEFHDGNNVTELGANQ